MRVLWILPRLVAFVCVTGKIRRFLFSVPTQRLRHRRRLVKATVGLCVYKMTNLESSYTHRVCVSVMVAAS